jgi:hypothetical protein
VAVRTAGLALVPLLTFAQSVLTGLYEVLGTVDLAGELIAALPEKFIYEQDSLDLLNVLNSISNDAPNIVSNVYTAVSSISFDDTSVSNVCIGVDSAQVCPFGFFTGDAPSGFFFYVVIWVGFWVLFTSIVAVGALARMTDS